MSINGGRGWSLFSAVDRNGKVQTANPTGVTTRAGTVDQDDSIGCPVGQTCPGKDARLANGRTRSPGLRAQCMQ